jgi:hypothetical protein
MPLGKSPAERLAIKVSHQCRRAWDASRGDPWDRDVRDGEMIIQEPTKYAAGQKIGGHFAWETPFQALDDAYVIGVHTYRYEKKDNPRSAVIDWAAKVVVYPEPLTVELVEIFGSVPRWFSSCLARMD